jgi:hypothetical protein
LTDDRIGGGTYVHFCFVKPEEATRITGMVASRVDLSGIRVDIDPKGKKYVKTKSGHIPDGDVLVVLKVPHEVVWSTFCREMCERMDAERVVEEERVEENTPMVRKVKKVLFG